MNAATTGVGLEWKNYAFSGLKRLLSGVRRGIWTSLGVSTTPCEAYHMYGRKWG